LRQIKSNQNKAKQNQIKSNQKEKKKNSIFGITIKIVVP